MKRPRGFLSCAFFASISVASVGVIRVSLRVGHGGGNHPDATANFPTLEIHRKFSEVQENLDLMARKQLLEHTDPPVSAGGNETDKRLIAASAIQIETSESKSVASGCFRLNSPDWIHGPRLGNEARLFNNDFVKQLLTGHQSKLDDQGLLAQSICYGTSRFRNISDSQVSEASVRAWTTRLLYLSMIHHQQQYASEEARVRFSNTHCAEEFSAKGIGLYDYECKGAKFLVTSLAGIGLGANMRGGAVHALLAGLVSDRVVLFVNGSPTGHKYLRKPWRLTSCRRKDYQCFFFPTSPCVLTHQDLHNAYSLTKVESKKLFDGIPPSGHENDKVWHLTVSFNPQTIPRAAAERLRNHSRWLVDTLPKHDPRLPVLYGAADYILAPDEPRPGLNYGAANVKIHHALVIFALRPNLFYSKKLSEIAINMMSRIIDPEQTVGLPIRASDKCNEESECLSFMEHLQATEGLLHDRPLGPKMDPTLIFTTESKAIVREQQEFSANFTAQSSLRHRFHIVANDHDVIPDTGFIKASSLLRNSSFSADDALFSAISSLQMQLLARVTVGNCCSNFHVLLADLLTSGCGAASENVFRCLQEHENPHYRLCCRWFRSCKEEKRLALNRWNAASRNQSTLAGQT